MMNILFLALLGAKLGVRRRVFVLIPAGFIISVVALSTWLAAKDLTWIKVVVGLAYLTTLSLGYVIGGLLVRSRTQPFSLEPERDAGMTRGH